MISSRLRLLLSVLIRVVPRGGSSAARPSRAAPSRRRLLDIRFLDELVVGHGAVLDEGVVDRPLRRAEARDDLVEVEVVVVGAHPRSPSGRLKRGPAEPGRAISTSPS